MDIKGHTLWCNDKADSAANTVEGNRKMTVLVGLLGVVYFVARKLERLGSSLFIEIVFEEGLGWDHHR